MKAQLEGGARADVVILSREGLSELIAAGRIVGGTVVDLARVPIGAAVRAGQPKPDVGTVAALTSTLLAAHAIANSGPGASPSSSRMASATAAAPSEIACTRWNADMASPTSAPA